MYKKDDYQKLLTMIVQDEEIEQCSYVQTWLRAVKDYEASLLTQRISPDDTFKAGVILSKLNYLEEFIQELCSGESLDEATFSFEEYVKEELCKIARDFSAKDPEVSDLIAIETLGLFLG